MDFVELVDIDNKPIQPSVLWNGRKNGVCAHACAHACVCVCMCVHYNSDGGSIIQCSGGSSSSSQCSLIDKEHWVIMQVCGGQEG